MGRKITPIITTTRDGLERALADHPEADICVTQGGRVVEISTARQRREKLAMAAKGKVGGRVVTEKKRAALARAREAKRAKHAQEK